MPEQDPYLAELERRRANRAAGEQSGGLDATGAGIDVALDAIQAGKTTVYEVMRGSGLKLESKFGRTNVRPILGAGGLTGHEVRTKPDQPWRPASANKQLSALVAERGERVMGETVPGRGAPAGERGAAKFKFNPEAELEYWRDKYGAENVEPIKGHQGQLKNIVIHDQAGESFAVNPDGFDLGDVAEFGAPAVRIGPGVVGGVIGGAVGGTPGALIGGGIGDIGGEFAAQAIGAALPGEERVTPGERFTAGVAAGAAGALGEGAGAVIGRAARGVSPTGIMGRKFGSEVVPQSLGEAVGKGQRGIIGREAAQELAGVGERAGVGLTPAQLTGGEAAVGFEDTLRQMPRARKIFKIADWNRAQNLGRFIDEGIKRAAGESPGAFRATQNVAKGFDRLKETIIGKADKKAGALFRQADASGEVVTTRAAFDILDDEVVRLGRVKGPDMSSQIKALEDIKERMTAEMTLSEWHATSREFGRGAVASALDMGTNHRVGKRLFKAMHEDLEAAGGGSVLMSAKRAYKGSRIAEERLNAEMLNNAAKLADARRYEQFVTDFWKPSITAGGVRKAMHLLKRDPVAHRELRAAVLDEFSEIASPRAGTELARLEGAVSPAGYVSAYAKHKDKLRALMGPKEFQQLSEANRIAEAITSTFKEGSPTLRRQLGVEWFGAITGAVSHPKETLDKLIMFQRGKKFAQILNNPDARDKFLRLVDPKRELKTREVSKLVARLAASLEMHDEDVRRGPEAPQPGIGVSGTEGVQFRGAGGL